MDYQLMGRQIRELRRQRGWTLQDLASQVGLSLSFMGHIERGTRKPSLETIVRLAQLFDVSIDSLLMPERNPASATHAAQELLKAALALCQQDESTQNT